MQAFKAVLRNSPQLEHKIGSYLGGAASPCAHTPARACRKHTSNARARTCAVCVRARTQTRACARALAHAHTPGSARVRSPARSPHRSRCCCCCFRRRDLSGSAVEPGGLVPGRRPPPYPPRRMIRACARARKRDCACVRAPARLSPRRKSQCVRGRAGAARRQASNNGDGGKSKQ